MVGRTIRQSAAVWLEQCHLVSRRRGRRRQHLFLARQGAQPQWRERLERDLDLLDAAATPGYCLFVVVGTQHARAARTGHTATLLPSGKVLVAGGHSGPGNDLSSAELYDPATNTWSPADRMTTARANYHSATLLPSGKVLVVGGLSPAPT